MNNKSPRLSSSDIHSIHWLSSLPTDDSTARGETPNSRSKSAQILRPTSTISFIPVEFKSLRHFLDLYFQKQSFPFFSLKVSWELFAYYHVSPGATVQAYVKRQLRNHIIISYVLFHHLNYAKNLKSANIFTMKNEKEHGYI